jgi:hypothetical protein
MAGGVAGDAGQDDASRRGLQIVDIVTGGERAGRISGAGRGGAIDAPAHVGLDIDDGGGGVGAGLAFERPGLFGAVDLAEIVDARILLRLQAGADEIGNGDGREQPDDGNDDHDLDEREARGAESLVLHIRMLLGCDRNYRAI